MFCKGGVFSLLLMSCCLEGSVPVFERHSNVHDGHGLASLIYSDEVWTEGLVRAWDRLVDPYGCRGGGMKRFD